MAEWQSIESAPKDGTAVLLVERTWGGTLVVTPGRWHEDEKGWWGYGSDPTDYVDDHIEFPLYWQPFPQPPKGDR